MASKANDSPHGAPPTIGTNLVLKLLQHNETEDGEKAGKKPNQLTLEVTGEAFRLFLVEAIQRAGHEARRQDENIITTKDLREIVGQLILDT
jgi:hypothetical protein